MKQLFEAATVAEVHERLAQLRPDSERLWGRMSAAQMLAHCAVSMGCAVGDQQQPRQLIGRLLGRFMKSRSILSDDPMPRNVPTTKWEAVTDERDFEAERRRLRGLIDRFAAGGPEGCTTHPHSFFGPLTPVEWARWMYKHLDHHMRQFQV